MRQHMMTLVVGASTAASTAGLSRVPEQVKGRWLWSCPADLRRCCHGGAGDSSVASCRGLLEQGTGLCFLRSWAYGVSYDCACHVCQGGAAWQPICRGMAITFVSAMSHTTVGVCCNLSLWQVLVSMHTENNLGSVWCGRQCRPAPCGCEVELGVFVGM